MMTYIDFTMLVPGNWLAQAMIWAIIFFDELNFFLMFFDEWLSFDSSVTEN